MGERSSMTDFVMLKLNSLLSWLNKLNVASSRGGGIQGEAEQHHLGTFWTSAFGWETEKDIQGVVVLF